ncbi:MAG: hypothetical protein ACFFBQ_20325 [Promethearchaeota archaeon]
MIKLPELEVFPKKQQEALHMILSIIQQVMNTLEELEARIETLEQ